MRNFTRFEFNHPKQPNSRYLPHWLRWWLLARKNGIQQVTRSVVSIPSISKSRHRSVRLKALSSPPCWNWKRGGGRADQPATSPIDCSVSFGAFVTLPCAAAGVFRQCNQSKSTAPLVARRLLGGHCEPMGSMSFTIGGSFRFDTAYLGWTDLWIEGAVFSMLKGDEWKSIVV